MLLYCAPVESSVCSACPVKPERHLVIVVIDTVSRVDADVEGLVDGHEDRNGVRHFLGVDLPFRRPTRRRCPLGRDRAPRGLKSNTIVWLAGRERRAFHRKRSVVSCTYSEYRLALGNDRARSRRSGRRACSNIPSAPPCGISDIGGDREGLAERLGALPVGHAGHFPEYVNVDLPAIGAPDADSRHAREHHCPTAGHSYLDASTRKSSLQIAKLLGHLGGKVVVLRVVLNDVVEFPFVTVDNIRQSLPTPINHGPWGGSSSRSSRRDRWPYFPSSFRNIVSARLVGTLALALSNV